MLEKRVQNIKPHLAAPDQVRKTIERLVIERGESLGALSRMIGRNDAYLQQFIRRGTPEKLAEDDRLLLAKFFQIDERLLGAREPWTPPAMPITAEPARSSPTHAPCNAGIPDAL